MIICHRDDDQVMIICHRDDDQVMIICHRVAGMTIR